MKVDNPFFVLELATNASPGEIERAGRKILGLLEVGSEKAATYTCFAGTFPRDATTVREAMAALRDPKRRARSAATAMILGGEPLAADPEDEFDAPLPDAFALAGLLGL